MAKKRSFKRALIMAILSMVLCLSMFAGTTFAWFTDSVTSSKNVIKAGNLDIELYYDNSVTDDWTKVTSDTNVFTSTLWEPGHTEVIKFKVANEGSLALKYQLGVHVASETGSTNVNGDEFKLSDFIKYGIVEGEQTYANRNDAIKAVDATATALNTAYSSTVTNLLATEEKYVTMVVYMPTTVENEANAKTGEVVPTINLAINLFATQVEAESDSFGDDYDEDSAWNGTIPTTQPDSLVVNSNTKLISINDADAFAYLDTLLNDGNFVSKYGKKWQYNVELNCNVNLLGNEWTPIVLSNVIGFDGKGHTISNLKITSGKDEVGLFGALATNDLGYGTIKNLTIDGAYVKGGKNSGVLVGSSLGTLENLTVLNATIEASKYVGGLAGRTCHIKNSTVKNSTVVASDKTVGGLVGYCVNDPGQGSATGNTVENVTVTGAWNVGGLLGQAQDVIVDGNAVKDSIVSSVKPLPEDASANEVRVDELAARHDFSNTVIGNNTIENVIDAEIVYIYNLNDFAEFGKAVNNNTKYNGSIVANNTKVWVEVMSDIDMTNAPGFQGGQFSIGNGNDKQFQGVFDGNGHTISNYTIIGSWTYNVSLFRTVSGNFTMKDITFENCSATKPNNREASILVGTIGGGTITFDNVDIKNSTVSGVAGASLYAGKMTEGALYFIGCDVDNSTINASSASATNAVFLSNGYSHHDYATSGVWVENCTVNNTKSFVNGVEETTVKEYNYTK